MIPNVEANKSVLEKPAEFHTAAILKINQNEDFSIEVPTNIQALLDYKSAVNYGFLSGKNNMEITHRHVLRKYSMVYTVMK